MGVPADNEEAASRFGLVAKRFCSAVDSVPPLDRNELLLQLYRILPQLISEAICLPEVELGDGVASPNSRFSHAEWTGLYERLRASLGDWDLYWQIFDPTKDNEAIHGSLADDIADIYLELKESLDDVYLVRAEETISEWRLGFSSHWGKHAIDALRTIHFRLGPY